MTALRDLFRLHRAAIFVLAATIFLMPPGGVTVAEAQVSVSVDVIIRNRIDPRQAIEMDCVLPNDSITPKAFLSGASAGSLVISEQLLDSEDAIFCNFKLGFVPKDSIQVKVRCTAVAGCSPQSLDFTHQGVYFDLMSGITPLGLPDIPWSSLLPPLPHW